MKPLRVEVNLLSRQEPASYPELFRLAGPFRVPLSLTVSRGTQRIQERAETGKTIAGGWLLCETQT